MLKLDFNERADKNNLQAKDYSFGEQLWQYPQRQPLEKQIAKFHDLSQEQVLCTNGGDESIMLLMRMVKEKVQGKSQIILPHPAFSQYTWGIKSWQQKACLIAPKNDLSIDLAALEDAIKSTPKSVAIITRPNNPTGESIGFEQLVKLIKLCKENDSWLFLDEAYIEFSNERSVANSLLDQFNNLIILRTLSKAYGLAGIRLGYLLSSKKIITEFCMRCMPFNISVPSLKIAENALLDLHQKEMQNYCKKIMVNREKLNIWLKNIGIEVFPSQANFIFFKLPKNQSIAVKSFLLKNKVLVREFDQFELSYCLRITVPFEIEKLLGLLKQSIQPQLICFDMDGVLIDTSQSYDQCVINCVKKLSGQDLTAQPLEELRRQGGFNNDWVLTKRLLDDLGYTFSLSQVTEVFQKIYLGENNNGLVKKERVIISEEMIKKINQVKLARFALVTGRPRREAESGQKLVNLLALDLISLDDVQQGKPSPEGIQRLQNKYSKSSWMVGDNPDDMQAALTSNSFAIGISVNDNKTKALYQSGADIVLKNINELEPWLCPIK